MNPNEICENCTYWFKIQPSGYYGECRRRAPSGEQLQLNMIAAQINERLETNRRARWTITSNDEWCGEFKEQQPLVSRPQLQPSTEALSTRITEIGLTNRALNCLASEEPKIEYVGDLVQLTESRIRSIPSCGKVSQQEIENKLKSLGLFLEMNLPNWKRKEI